MTLRRRYFLAFAAKQRQAFTDAAANVQDGIVSQVVLQPRNVRCKMRRSVFGLVVAVCSEGVVQLGVGNGTAHGTCLSCGMLLVGELRATVNRRTNLAHCFCCGSNFNNIDLLMSLDYDFLSAVELLEHWLRGHQRRTPAKP